MKLIKLLSASAGAGLFLASAFPPFDLPIPGLLALPLLLLLVIGRAPGVRFIAGTMAGLVFFGLHLYWIARFGWYALLLLSLVQALFVGGFALLSSLLAASRPAVASLSLGGAWVALELLRGLVPFGGFPWAPLGSSLHGVEAARALSRFIGTSGLSALIVAAGVLLLFLLVPNRLRSNSSLGISQERVEAGAGLVLLVIALLLGWSQPTGGEGKSVRVAVVQAGIEVPWTDPADPAVVLENHVRLTKQLAGRELDLIAWGENVIEGGASPEILRGLARDEGVSISAGAVREGSAGWRNLVIAVRPDGSFQQYSKQRPVPFGEYLPLRFLFGRIPVLSREVPHDMERGRGPFLFTYPFGRSSAVVSYESAFPGLVRKTRNRGAELIEVHTNNSSFGRSPASEQHLSLDRMRAAELGVPVVRAAITGISALIDERGRMLGRLELYEQGVLTGRLRLGGKPTPYSRYGDLTLAYPLVAFAALCLPARSRHKIPGWVK